jgi:hypothetical protein
MGVPLAAAELDPPLADPTLLDADPGAELDEAALVVVVLELVSSRLPHAASASPALPTAET